MPIIYLKTCKRASSKIQYIRTQGIAHLIVINLRCKTREFAVVGASLMNHTGRFTRFCTLTATLLVGGNRPRYAGILRKREEPCVTLEIALVALHFIGSPPLSSIVISATFLLEAFYVSEKALSRRKTIKHNFLAHT